MKRILTNIFATFLFLLALTSGVVVTTAVVGFFKGETVSIVFFIGACALFCTSLFLISKNTKAHEWMDVFLIGILN